MAGSGLWLSLLVLLYCYSTVTVAGTGVENRISDSCLECLKRVQPSPDKVCIDFSEEPDVPRCGQYKMKQIFYDDCRLFWDRIPEEWDTFKKCYEDDECGKRCVEAYHNRYSNLCVDTKPITNESLTCADYGQIHFGGPMSCARPDLAVPEVILNMTLLCGCETVHGNREKCLSEMAKEQQTCPTPDHNSNQVIIIVAVVCASIVVIVSVVIIVLCCSKYQRSRGLMVHSNTAAGVEAQKFQPRIRGNGYPNEKSNELSSPRIYSSNRLSDDNVNIVGSHTSQPQITLLSSPESVAQDSFQNPTKTTSEAEVQDNGEVFKDESVPTKLEAPSSIGDSNSELSIGPSEPGIEPGYVNVASISNTRFSTDSGGSLNRIRVPIPSPRE